MDQYGILHGFAVQMTWSVKICGTAMACLLSISRMQVLPSEALQIKSILPMTRSIPLENLKTGNPLEDGQQKLILC